MNEDTKNPNEILDQLPPHDNNAEISVLGGALGDKEGAAMAVEMLVDSNRSKKFYSTKHQYIFNAIVDLYEDGVAVDIITVGEKLSRDGKLDLIGGNYYLTELVSRVPSAANITYHCQIVNEMALSRNLIDSCVVTAKRCFDQRERIRDILNEHSATVFDFQIRKKDEWITLADAAIQALDNLQKAKSEGSEVAGIPTGFTELDELTGGLHRSDLIVVGGRPSMGKTAFMMGLAQGTAERGFYPDIFSLEMTSIALALRALSSKARMNSQKFRLLKYLSFDDLKKLALTINANIEPWKRISLQDTSGLTPIEMRARLKRLWAKNPSIVEKSLVFVDYTQIISPGKRYGSREQEVSFISGFLKRIAKDFNVPVIAFSQLSRAVESRGGDRRPTLSDLRESGAIEQDADTVFFLYRPEYYEKSDKENIAEVIIGKQRNGPLGTSELYFAKEFTTFANLEVSTRSKQDGKGLFHANNNSTGKGSDWTGDSPF